MSILKQNDTVGLISPAGPINQSKLDKTLSNLSELGLSVKYGKSLTEQTGYFAGSGQSRIAELQNMFCDTDINAVLAVRGGYGTTTILDKLDYKLIAGNPKPLIGFSDITALLQALHKFSKVPVYHGIVGASNFTNYTKKCFSDIFLSDLKEVEINSYKFDNDNDLYKPFVIHSGKAEGELIGGNLSLLTSLVGTNYDTDWAEKIVFIEEVNEAPYAVDRMLTQLFLAGKFKNVKGIIFGIFAGCDKKSEQSFTLQETLTRLIKPLKIPAVYGFSFGHIENQAIFRIGAKAEFSSTDFKIIMQN